jgi:hypothetical protein
MDKKQLKVTYDLDSPGMYDCLTMGEELPEPIQKMAPIKFAGWGS